MTIVVHAQSQFNVLLAALLICLLHMWIQFYVLFLFETVTMMVSCVTLPWSLQWLFWMLMNDLWYIKRNDFLRFETLDLVLKFTKNFVLKFHHFLPGPLQYRWYA